MWSMLTCDCDSTQRVRLLNHVRRFFEERGIGARMAGCADWPGLSRLTRELGAGNAWVLNEGREE